MALEYRTHVYSSGAFKLAGSVTECPCFSRSGVPAENWNHFISLHKFRDILNCHWSYLNRIVFMIHRHCLRRIRCILTKVLWFEYVPTLLFKFCTMSINCRYEISCNLTIWEVETSHDSPMQDLLRCPGICLPSLWQTFPLQLRSSLDQCNCMFHMLSLYILPWGLFQTGTAGPVYHPLYHSVSEDQKLDTG